MKFSTVIVSALAAVVSAAPAKKEEARSSFDASQFNNFKFNSQNLNYLSVINSLDFNILQQLAQVNNFSLQGFSNLFSGSQFNLNSILQLQQAQTLIQLEQLGVLSGFDLSTLQLNNIGLGLIQNQVGALDLSQFIDASLAPQIQTIIQQSVSIVKE